MKLEPDKIYKVTKGNTDKSVLTGDLVYIDGKSGALVVPKGRACHLSKYIKKEIILWDLICTHISSEKKA